MRVTAALSGLVAGIIIMFIYSSTGTRFIAAMQDDNTLNAVDQMTLAGTFFLFGAVSIWKQPLWGMGLYGVGAVLCLLARNEISDGWGFAFIGLIMMYEAWQANKEMQADDAWIAELQAFVRSQRNNSTGQVRVGGADMSFYQQLAASQARLAEDNKRLGRAKT